MPTRALSDRDHDLLFGEDALEPGDAVVHFEHGLAAYDGEERVDLGDAAQSLTRLVYRNGGKLLLPAQEGVDFWRYGTPADAVTLDRLKTDDWTRHRDDMIAELKDSVDAMLADDAARRSVKAIPVAADDKAMAAFAKGFGHRMTADQRRATDHVMQDLARDVPMNRLLVGDVGFGKTEIALRAAAATALAGHQVALAAPTTVLARQHVTTFRARCADAGVIVAELSRLTSDADRTEIVAGLADGSVHIVIGTHSLLDDGIAFDSLALVVIDEEQKFGEDQKARLRNLSPGCHILSMTATPIPRSLAAAEVGLIDVSVVATAPKSRQPVETRTGVCDHDDLLRAVNAEVAREGQCYIVCPRISDVTALDTALRTLDVGFSYIVAHGQMPDEEMADAMLRFMQGEVDVLLSTSIVESGLDNGRANTMVVWHADRFGLSQLHQLRGRIGRSKLPAHMLLMTDVDLDDPDCEAAPRLRAFCDMSEVGAGFRIARRDRDIRGFGDLDGTAQSGQISRLGIGLYRHVLRMHMDGKRLTRD